MKRFSLLLLVLFALTSQLIGQKVLKASPRSKTAPPLARLDETPSKLEGFSINFPGPPVKSIVPINAAFGMTDIKVYQFSSSLSFYRVSYFDLPAVLDDEADIKIRFDWLKNTYLSKGDAVSFDDHEVRFGDHPGREFSIETPVVSFTVRCIAIQQRIFELVVGTKGSYRQWTDRIKDFHKKNTENFFNSFSADKVPPPKLSAVPLPADFGEKVEGSVFSVNFFHLSMTLPPTWHRLTGEMLELAKDIGRESVKRHLPDQILAVERSIKNSQELLLMTRVPVESGENDAVLEIVAEKSEFPNFLPEAITKNISTRYLGVSDTVTKPITPVKLGGVDFSCVEVLLGDKNLKKRVYVANLGGVIFEIALIYRKDEDLQVMLRSVDSLKIAR